MTRALPVMEHSTSSTPHCKLGLATKASIVARSLKLSNVDLG